MQTLRLLVFRRVPLSMANYTGGDVHRGNPSGDIHDFQRSNHLTIAGKHFVRLALTGDT